MGSKVNFFTYLIAAYAGIVVVLCFFLKLTGSYFKKEGETLGYRLSRVLSFLLVLPLAILFLSWIDANFIEPNWIAVQRLDVKAKQVDDNVRNLKIIELSDLHIENNGFREKSLIQKVNALKPDIIFITGDFLNFKKALPAVPEVLKQLKAPRGIYAILGNNDYYFVDEARMIAALASAGVSVLRYENREIYFGNKGYFWLVGLSDPYKQTAYLEEAFKGIPEGAFKIVLIHDPDLFDSEVIQRYGPEFVLAGHTHGGQFGIPFIRKFSPYAERSKYMSGLFKAGDNILYVNRGIGMHTRDVRFFCRPEITVIKLHRE